MNRSMIHNPHLDGDPFFWESGPVGIVLSHGFSATPAEVRPLAQLLLQQGYTVAGPLLPGHYTRPEDLNRVRWQDWVAAFETTYQQVAARCDQVLIGGESTGAVLALYLASEHPEIAGVLTYAPAIRLTIDRLTVFKMQLAAPFIPYVPKESLDAAENWQGYPVNPLKGALQLLRLQKVVAGRLNRIHQPVLIVQGELDTIVDRKAPALIAAGISSTIKEIHWMKKSSHVVCIDQELDKVAEITLMFIQRVLRGAAR